MSVEYSRELCDTYVEMFCFPPAKTEEIGSAAGPVSFEQSVLLGYTCMAFGYVGWIKLWAHHEEMLKNFRCLSRWNQQGILYQMVPRIEALTKKLAHDRCKEAREKEPL